MLKSGSIRKIETHWPMWSVALDAPMPTGPQCVCASYRKLKVLHVGHAGKVGGGALRDVSF